jgi:hypothetical protein
MEKDSSRLPERPTKSKLSLGTITDRLSVLGSVWGDQSQVLENEEYLVGEMDIFSQSKKIFDLMHKHNPSFIRFSMVFYETKCSLCINHINSNYWIKITSSIQLKKKNVAARPDEPLLACCFELTPFRNMFSLLLSGKRVEFVAVKADREGGVIIHFRQFSTTNMSEWIEFTIHGVKDQNRDSDTIGQLRVFETTIEMGSKKEYHGCVISFENASILNQLVSFGVSMNFQYIGFRLKSVIGNRLELGLYKSAAELSRPPEHTITMEAGRENFKATSFDRNFTDQTTCIFYLRVFALISKLMERDMPLTLAFHKKGFIYITGKLITDSFEVLVSQVDLENLDENNLERGSVAMEDERMKAMGDSDVDDDLAQSMSWHKLPKGAD